MIRDLDLARRLYAPSAESLRGNLPAMADSLSAACYELERDLTLDRLDRLTAQLSAAQTNLVHLRKALISEQSGVHRGGTG